LVPEKADPTGEFVIVAMFGGCVLHHLASRLANVIREEGRNGGKGQNNGGRETKNQFKSVFKLL